MRAKATIAGSCCQEDLSGIYEYGLWEQSSVDERGVQDGLSRSSHSVL